MSCDCSACEAWHGDGGEGPSMFCEGVEPTVVERGPNWEPVSNAKDQVSLSALRRSFPVPSAWLVTYGWGRDFWLNQENGYLTCVGPLPSWSDVGKAAGWRIFSWPG